MRKRLTECDRDGIIAGLQQKLDDADKKTDFYASQCARQEKQLTALKQAMNSMALQMRAMVSAAANNWNDDDIPF